MSTVRSLEEAGLIERDPDEGDEDAYRTTPGGREALGIVLEPKPRGLKAALLRAIRVFLPVDYADEVEIEAEPRIRKGSTLTVHIPNPRRIEDMEEEWSAVETLVCEWGWPVEIETETINCTVMVEWLDE